jgi:hypothetical protein
MVVAGAFLFKKTFVKEVVPIKNKYQPQPLNRNSQPKEKK